MNLCIGKLWLIMEKLLKFCLFCVMKVMFFRVLFD